MGHAATSQEHELLHLLQQRQLVTHLHNKQQPWQSQSHQLEDSFEWSTTTDIPTFSNEGLPRSSCASRTSVPCDGSNKNSNSFFQWLKANDDEQLWKCAWTACSDEVSSTLPILVVDVGTQCLRISRVQKGSEGEDQSTIFAQSISKPWNTSDGYLPVCGGVIQDWEKLEDELERVFASVYPISASALGGRYLSCISSLRSPCHFARTGEIFFETMEAQAFLNVDQDTLSALAICGAANPQDISSDVGVNPAHEASDSYATSAARISRSMMQFTGIVVDLGVTVTRVCPLFSGLAMGGLAVELPLGGCDLDRFVSSAIEQRNTRLSCVSSVDGNTSSEVHTSEQSNSVKLVQDKYDVLKQRQNTSLNGASCPPCQSCLFAVAREGKESFVCCADDPGTLLTMERAFHRMHPRAVDVSSIPYNAACARHTPSEMFRESAVLAGHGLEDCISCSRFNCFRKCENKLSESRYAVHSLLLGEECVTASEIFFDGCALGNYRRQMVSGPSNYSEFMTLQEAIFEVIDRCPIDLRRLLSDNIYIVGGTSLIPGLGMRLQNELQRIHNRRKAHCSNPPSVHALRVKELRHHAAICGGVRFAVGPQYDLNHITKLQYEECGPSIFEKFSFRGRFR